MNKSSDLPIDQYTYRVMFSPQDREFVATVAEFPLLSWLDETQEGALRGMRELLGQVVADMREQDEAIPLPFPARTYSGNIKVRVSPEKHRDLTLRAAELGISLNRYLNEVISLR